MKRHGFEFIAGNGGYNCVAKLELKMHAETLLRKLHMQKALSEDELNAYLEKVNSDGSLPTGEILTLLELMKQRIREGLGRRPHGGAPCR